MPRETKIDKENKNRSVNSPKITFSNSKTPPENRSFAPLNIFGDSIGKSRLASPRVGEASLAKSSADVQFPFPFSPSSKKESAATPFCSFMGSTELARKESAPPVESEQPKTSSKKTERESSRLPMSLENLIISEREDDGFWADQARQLSLALAGTRAKLEKAEGSLAQAILFEKKNKDFLAEIALLREDLAQFRKVERALETRAAEAQAQAERWEAKARALHERMDTADPRQCAEVKRLSEALAGLSAANNDLQRRNKELGLKVFEAADKLQRENQMFSVANEKLSAQLRTSESQSNFFQGKIAQLQAEMAMALAENRRLTDALSKSEQSVIELRGELKTVDQLQEELCAVRVQLAASEKARDFQATHLKALIENSIADSQFGEVALLRAKVAELQCLTTRTSISDEKSRTSEQQNRTSMAEIKSLTAQLSTKFQENEQLLQQLHALDAERSEYQIAVSEIEYLRSLNAQLAEKCEELRDKLSKAEHQALTAQIFENQVRHLEKEVAALRKEFAPKMEAAGRFSARKKETYLPSYKQ